MCFSKCDFFQNVIIPKYKSNYIYIYKEYEKETTETVQALFNQIEELFYESKITRKKKSSSTSVQEKECQIWREHFPHFRLETGS